MVHEVQSELQLHEYVWAKFNFLTPVFSPAAHARHVWHDSFPNMEPKYL